MAGNRNLITTESRGKGHGDKFDDLQVIQDRENGVISRIDIRHGACLDAITVGRSPTLQVDGVLTVRC